VHPITRLAGPIDGVITRTEEVGELAILCPRASPHPYPCRITRAIIFPVDPVASLRRAAPRFPQRTQASSAGWSLRLEGASDFEGTEALNVGSTCSPRCR